jgi:hypothetical protein
MSNYAQRLPESLKTGLQALGRGRRHSGESVAAIAEKISAMETADFFERRSSKASKVKADKVWAKVSDKNAFSEDGWSQK